MFWFSILFFSFIFPWKGKKIMISYIEGYPLKLAEVCHHFVSLLLCWHGRNRVSAPAWSGGDIAGLEGMELVWRGWKWSVETKLVSMHIILRLSSHHQLRLLVEWCTCVRWWTGSSQRANAECDVYTMVANWCRWFSPEVWQLNPPWLGNKHW